METNPHFSENEKKFEWKVLKAAKTGVAIFVAVALLVLASDVFLLAFAGILLAIFLMSLARWLCGVSRLSYRWALSAVCLILLSVIVLAGWAAAPSVAEQFDELTRQVPRSIEKIKAQLQHYSWAEPFVKEADPEQAMKSGREVLYRASGWLSGILGGLASFVVVLFLGLYGAAEPETYKHGFIRLFPLQRRARVAEVLEETRDTLKWWLIGKFMSMAVIGILTTLGLWLMDVPLAFILGLIAALLTFIPNIGPLLAAAPAVLLGLVDGPTQALYIGLLYIGIQTVESYLITPLIQRKTIKLPPGLTLATQVFLGIIFGGIGVALATPLTAVAVVGIKRFYVEDTLGDPVPDEEAKNQSSP